MKCFVDTGAFAALYARNDARHGEAAAIWRRLRGWNASLVTTRDVISETVTLLRRRAGFRAASQCGDDLWKSPVLEIVRTTAAQDEAAWEWFQRYSDKEFSYADCVSFAIMRELRLDKAFTFDRNFEQAGFSVLKPE